MCLVLFNLVCICVSMGSVVYWIGIFVGMSCMLHLSQLCSESVLDIESLASHMWE